MEEDNFIQEFMRRAQKRQAQLTAANLEKEVCYPPLSPLPEEETVVSESSEKNDQNSTDDELNYSSDLSLDCDNESEVYRAEPVVCHSSPERIVQASPRKQPITAPSSSEHQQPLQELQNEQKPSSSQSLPETSNGGQSLKDLQAKVDRAEQMRTQLKKAVEISKYGSKEHVEAAKLLQLAEIEHLNCTNFMAMFKQGIRKKTESLGSIVISNMKIKLSSKLKNDLADENVSHYFFSVASFGTDVKSTAIINTNDIRRQDLKDYLQFKENINFVDLPPDFVIKVEVFELVISQQFPNLFSMLTPSKKSKMTLEQNFKRVGSMKLTIADRNVSYKNLTQWSKREESKYIERECKLLIELKPEQLPRKVDMLHVQCLDGSGRPDWSRFWVESSNGLIRFWKSRQDSLEEKKPNQILELKDLCSERVQKLTPDDDFYRQNSFVMYSLQQVAGGEKDHLFQRVLEDDPKYKVVKHQLAAENKEDRDSWCSILSHSLHCFREWHGKTTIYNMDEIKEIFSSLH